VIDRLNPLTGEKLILLADPQRMIGANHQPRLHIVVRFVTSIEEVLQVALLKEA
jgi:hypothetical protein